MSQKRRCSKCKECCYASVVIFDDGYVKPSLVWCKHLCEKGCGIYEDDIRPEMCAIFFCPWMRGFGEEGDRPDKSRVFLAMPAPFNGGIWIVCMNLEKNAHRDTGKKIILEIAEQVDIPVIVVDFDDLKYGKGDYVIIKDSLQHRSSQIKGEFIGDFGHMKEYKLEIS